MYVTASDTVNIPVEFKGSDGELIVPDAGTFDYIVQRLDGTVVLPLQTPTLPSTATEAIISLGSPTTDMVTANDSENLLLKYRYDRNGLSVTGRLHITLIQEPKYIVGKADVRNALGATDLILPDEMIDLHLSYITLKNGTELGARDFDTLLLAGGYNAQLANNALKYYAAIAGLDKLALTLIKTHTEDNISVTHFETDLKALKARMTGKYYEALSGLNPELDATLRLVSDLFVVANPTPDVITGA